MKQRASAARSEERSWLCRRPSRRAGTCQAEPKAKPEGRRSRLGAGQTEGAEAKTGAQRRQAEGAQAFRPEWQPDAAQKKEGANMTPQNSPATLGPDNPVPLLVISIGITDTAH